MSAWPPVAAQRRARESSASGLEIGASRRAHSKWPWRDAICRASVCHVRRRLRSASPHGSEGWPSGGSFSRSIRMPTMSAWPSLAAAKRASMQSWTRREAAMTATHSGRPSCAALRRGQDMSPCGGSALKSILAQSSCPPTIAAAKAADRLASGLEKGKACSRRPQRPWEASRRKAWLIETTPSAAVNSGWLARAAWMSEKRRAGRELSGRFPFGRAE